jgi:hypothetical protein
MLTILPFLEAVFFPLVEQICFCRSQVYNFWASVSIFLLLYTFAAIIRVRNTRIPTYDTPAF